MTYKYILTLERDGETITYKPTVYFAKGEHTYGNGFHMKVENCGFGFMDVFDCRYDTRLDSRKLNEYFPIFAKDRWDGKNGSAKLIDIKEIH